MGQQDNAKKLEDQAKADASKLLEVLAGPDFQQLRDQHRFTLESLQKEKGIKLEDCHALHKYAKILYEQGKYKGKFTNFDFKTIAINTPY